MRRTYKLAAGLAALAAAGGALQLADGSQADRPPGPKARQAIEVQPVTPERHRLKDDKKDVGSNPFLPKSSSFRGLAKAASFDPTANFDPIVKGALDDAAGISGLVDEVLADLPAQGLVPSLGGVTPGDIAGGSGTDGIVGFINGGGANITGITNRVLAGEELTPEQLEICEFLLRKGPSIDAWGDIMAVNDQIDIDLANAHLRELYPLGFTDSYGNRWMPDHETGRWTKVTEHPTGGSRVYHPGPLAPPPSFPNEPPSSPGDNSGSIDNDEPTFDLFD
jgi:hypothetical protein